jgi:hypothetical protein
MGQHILFQVRELTFDAVEPRGVGGQKLQAHVVEARPVDDLGCLVGAQVVQDDPNPAAIAAANDLEKTQKVARPFAADHPAPQSAAGDFVGAHQVAHAVAARVGGAQPVGAAVLAPRGAGVRTQFQRTEFIDADYRFAAAFGRAVQPFDGVFFTSNCGSSDCFQVLVRWSER